MTSAENRLPGPTVTPEIGYRDPHTAIRWLCDVLGTRRGLIVERPDGGVAHAELWWYDGAVFVGMREAEDGDQERSVVCLVASDGSEVDRIWERVLDAHAEVVFPLSDTPFGSHQCVVRDPEGNTWTIGTYRPEPPADKA
jgi:uncharacterized glyoxalase superfamily protein PhnB